MRYIDRDLSGITGICNCPVWARMTIINAESIEIASWPLTTLSDPETDSAVVEALAPYGPVEWIVACPMCADVIATGLLPTGDDAPGDAGEIDGAWAIGFAIVIVVFLVLLAINANAPVVH